MLKPNILRNQKDFNTLYSKGKSVGGRYVVLFYRKNGKDFTRKAFLASKKVGNAVERNRARRLMKESYRLIEGNLKPGYDIILIARNTIKNTKCADVKKSIEAAMKRVDLLERK